MLAASLVSGGASHAQTSGFEPEPANAPQSPEPWIQKIDLFTSGTQGYELYRIPGIVITDKGTLLVYCDARRTIKFGDWGEIDIASRRSVDGGRTWSPQNRAVSVERLTSQAFHFEQNSVPTNQGLSVSGKMLIDNQAPVVDRMTGTLFLLYCANYNRCFVERSDDDGATFSRPSEITSVFEGFRPDYPWKVIATGPNHGIQLRGGRLLMPIWLSSSGGHGGHSPSAVATIYSDDHGLSWHRGSIVASNTPTFINPNETVAVELSNGAVMLNMRSQSLQNRRAVSYSPDGASDWTQPEFVNDLADPECMAGLTRLSSAAKGGRSRLIFSFCDNATDPIPGNNPIHMLKRKNLTVALSYDEGRTWPVRRVIEPGWAGYSDLGVAPDGTIYCFYESGSLSGDGRSNQNAHLTLARFNLAWITGGAEHL